MAIQYCDQIRENHIAPGVSSFTAADVPDMSDYFSYVPVVGGVTTTVVSVSRSFR